MFLYEEQSYTKQIEALISSIIYEYDISKANINVLLKRGDITQEQYDHFYSLPKQIREVTIGKLQRDFPSLKTSIKEGFKEARRDFFIANNISNDEVLSIKSDAIFIIGRPALVTEFGNIKFIHKNTYTTFLRFHHLELYYYIDTKGAEILDIKGIKDEVLDKHRGFFLDFVLDVLYSLENEPIEMTIAMIKSYYRRYITGQVPLESYRRFDSQSLFNLKSIPASFGDFKISTLSPDIHFNNLDIMYNLEVIRTLYKLATKIYLG